MKPKHLVLILILALLIVVGGGIAAFAPWKSGPRPDIILIVIDTLRPDHLGTYGYDLPTSPNIDAFAEDAVVFEDCRSHSSDTRLSVASMLSGFYPHEARLMEARTAVPDDVEMAAEILNPLGYKTAAVISNFMLSSPRHGMPDRNYDQGFDIYDDDMREREKVRANFPERTAGPTTDRAVQILEQHDPDQPLFLWVHYQDPHGPYTPPREFGDMMKRPGVTPRRLELTGNVGGGNGIPNYQQLDHHRDYHHYVAQYDGEIRYLDGHVDHGYYDNALIILTSDHGEGMGEQNWYFAHGWNLHKSLIHVPLIVKYGDQLSGRRDDRAQHIDILPTIFSLLELDPNPLLRGSDLMKPLGTGRPIVSQVRGLIGDVYALHTDGTKVIAAPDIKRFDLYDTNADPNETHNLQRDPKSQALANQQIGRLQAILDDDRLNINVLTKEQQLTAQQIQDMEDAGYLEGKSDDDNRKKPNLDFNR